MSNSSKSTWKVQWKVAAALAAASIVPFAVMVATVGVDALSTLGGISAVVILFMGLLTAWGLLSGVTRQADALNTTLARINEGDFEARVDVLTNDELGKSAEALNVMCDNTLNLLQSKNEQGQVQNSIESLISQMEKIAAGDLTIAAKNNGDITGAVADSVNNMTAQLRTLVERVQHATQHVSVSAIKMRDNSTRVTAENDQRAGEIQHTSQQLLEMTEAFQTVAALTEESSQVAVEARQTASEGRKAVNDTVEGMQRIRTQVQNTSKRIKRLGESSQEIGEIVQLISDIADRTSVLALNASIQAAMAGDAGSGFAVVAEEVERLAERSTSATDQIAKLIRGIQAETGQAIADMEESTREVVAGSSLATQAGETLGEIDGVSNQLVDLIKSVSKSARAHAQQSEKIAATMAQVSNNTRQSAETNRKVTQSVNQLARMADSLSSSVSRFNIGHHGSAAPMNSVATNHVAEENTSAANPPATAPTVAPSPAAKPQNRVTATVIDPVNSDGPHHNKEADESHLLEQLKAVESMMNDPQGGADEKKLLEQLQAVEKLMNNKQHVATEPAPKPKPQTKTVGSTVHLD